MNESNYFENAYVQTRGFLEKVAYCGDYYVPGTSTLSAGMKKLSAVGATMPQAVPVTAPAQVPAQVPQVMPQPIPAPAPVSPVLPQPIPAAEPQQIIPEVPSSIPDLYAAGDGMGGIITNGANFISNGLYRLGGYLGNAARSSAEWLNNALPNAADTGTDWAQTGADLISENPEVAGGAVLGTGLAAGLGYMGSRAAAKRRAAEDAARAARPRLGLGAKVGLGAGLLGASALAYNAFNNNNNNNNNQYK